MPISSVLSGGEAGASRGSLSGHSAAAASVAARARTGGERATADSFVPADWLPNPHLMTVGAHYLRRPIDLPVWRERWELPDGDFVDVDRLAGKTPFAPLVIICHGLEGSSRSLYVRGIIARARARGFAALALNFRGCSGELNRLPRFYHSGDTGDLGYVVERVVDERKGRRVGLVGFSLGGNVVTKYLGEKGGGAPPALAAAAVVSAPFDLAGCCRALDGRGLPATLYRTRFLRTLLPKALAKAVRFPHLFDTSRVRRAKLLREYDDVVTAPLHGFKDADDYYEKSSSRSFLHSIRRPLAAISATDDPFVPGDTIPAAALHANPRIVPIVSNTGGHVAFVAGPPWRMQRWAEDRAVAFLADHFAAP